MPARAISAARKSAMKLVTWNCAMALHKKHEKLVQFDADILVIQECSRTFIRQMNRSEGWTSVWYGKNPNKGLGVLVKAPWTIRSAYAMRPRWAAKLVIDGPVPVELFPVWACKGNRAAQEYIGQVHRLLDVIERTSFSAFTVVLGDFNSNSRWDHQHRTNSHSDAVERFRKLGLKSAYHEFFTRTHGKERHPTYWHTKNSNKPYHIDYIFLSGPLLSKLKRVRVGHSSEWLSLSDHAPMFVELDL
jgi:exonuclease III